MNEISAHKHTKDFCDILNYCLENLDGTVFVESWGEKGIYYNPNHVLKRGVYILPHPVYAWMAWICVLNPSEQTFEGLKSYIQESYEFAKEKFQKRRK